MNLFVSMLFGFIIGFARADVAFFNTDCYDFHLKECGKKHAEEMDELIKKVGYPRSHSTVFVSDKSQSPYFMTTMIY